jgi:hypothetical protein
LKNKNLGENLMMDDLKRGKRRAKAKKPHILRG